MSTQKVAFQLVLPSRKSWMARALSIGNKFRVKGKVGNSEGEISNIAIKSTTVCTVQCTVCTVPMKKLFRNSKNKLELIKILSDRTWS